MIVETEKQEKIRKRLEAIAEMHGGKLTPEAVVEDARSVDSPLHDSFQWDMEKAAQQYWLDTARHIIRSVRIQIQTETIILKSVAYVRDPSAAPDEQGYIHVSNLKTDKDMARASLIAEFQRIAALLYRANELAVVLGLEGDIDEIQQHVLRVSEQVRELHV